MKLSGQLHALATFPLVPIGWEVGWTPEPVWTTWRRENSWPYWDSNSVPSVTQPVASHYTDYTPVHGLNTKRKHRNIEYIRCVAWNHCIACWRASKQLMNLCIIDNIFCKIQVKYTYTNVAVNLKVALFDLLIHKYQILQCVILITCIFKKFIFMGFLLLLLTWVLSYFGIY
jgi:hypothetical protein